MKSLTKIYCHFQLKNKKFNKFIRKKTPSKFGIVIFVILSLGFNDYFSPFWIPAFASMNYVLAQISGTD